MVSSPRVGSRAGKVLGSFLAFNETELLGYRVLRLLRARYQPSVEEEGLNPTMKGLRPQMLVEARWVTQPKGEVDEHSNAISIWSAKSRGSKRKGFRFFHSTTLLDYILLISPGALVL